MLIKRHSTGQTLLEAMVAIGVIMTAVFGATTLIISSITAGRISQNRVEAANFAREGVEIVRAIRDSNWLKFEQNELDPSTGAPPLWNAGLSAGTKRAVLSFGLTNTWLLQSCTGGCTASNTVIYKVTHTSGRVWYAQYQSQAACNAGGRTCVATKFNRTIQLSYINDDLNSDGTAEQYLLAVATVNWTDRSGPKTLSAQTRFYDWK